jgi:hypothetical protein
MKRLLTLLALTCATVAAFGATLNPIQLLNPTGSTSGQAIVSTGASSAPAWGNVTVTALAAQAANTVVANVTASSASPTAFAMPSCSTSTSALQYTSGTGFTCFAGSAPLASPTFTGTVTTAALTATGLISPSSTVGIKGTATNDSAQAGSIGEYLTGTTSGTSLTSGAAGNCASVSLTAGDWDVSGVVRFVATSATAIGNFQSGITATSATFGGLGTQTTLQTSWTAGAAIDEVPTPVVRQSLASTTTVFIVALSSFGGTMTCNGFIRARRVR